MTVRRLTQWTKQFCSRVAARLRGATQQPQPDREPVLSVSASARLVGSPSVAASITATHWLDDARRMRPRRVRSIPLPQPAADEKPQEMPTRMSLDTTSVRAPSPVNSPNSAPLPTDRTTRSTSREPQPQPHRPEPAHEAPPVAEQPETDATSIDEKLRRRLRSLQFLVRHGVYNEGFTRGSLPEQYRRSAGVADDEEMPL